MNAGEPRTVALNMTRKKRGAPTKITVVKRSPMRINATRRASPNRTLQVPLLNNLERNAAANILNNAPDRAEQPPRRGKQQVCAPAHEKLAMLKPEIAVRFFIWLDSISVSASIKPRLKDCYRQVWDGVKAENFPCLSDEKKKFRLMLIKAMRADYKPRAVRDIIRFFMRHFEEIVDRIDRCGLGADAYVDEKLAEWMETR